MESPENEAMVVKWQGFKVNIAVSLDEIGMFV
jgi:hypothetical protein